MRAVRGGLPLLRVLSLVVATSATLCVVLAGATSACAGLDGCSGSTPLSGHGLAAPNQPAIGRLGPLSKTGSESGVSVNWSGYVALSDQQATAVKSTFVQPTVKCPVPGAWTVFWVGLDGWLNNNVEQAGTAAQCSTGSKPKPSYYAWWEMYPTNWITPMPISISPGDTITSSAIYSLISESYALRVEDLTNGQSNTETAKCAPELECQRSSAEAIVERPTSGSELDPLADWGTMSLGDDKVAVVNHETPRGAVKPKYRALTAFRTIAVEMSSSERTLAQVGPLSKPGPTFTDTWRAAR